MLIVVKERTKEIGIKRALGATPWKIIGQIILESVFLTTIAGYLGLVIGIGILELVNTLMGVNPDGGMFKNPEVDLNVALTALSILIVSGALAGFIPARRAVQVKPIEALRADG
jgi:putative ABC transport system permease protein